MVISESEADTYSRPDVGSARQRCPPRRSAGHCRAGPGGHTMRSVMQRWFSHGPCCSRGVFPCRGRLRRGDGLAGPAGAGRNGLSWFTPSNGGPRRDRIAAWWHLIHESAEAREARRKKREEVDRARRQAEMVICGGPSPADALARTGRSRPLLEIPVASLLRVRSGGCRNP